MHLLVTGGTGFIGRHMVEYFQSRYPQFQITIACRNPEDHLPAGKNIRHISFDITRPDTYSNLFSTNYDVLIHLAWPQIHHYNDPAHIEKILPANQEFLKTAGRYCQSISVAGTCFEYGLQNGCLDETAACQPVTTYGKAKNSLRKFFMNGTFLPTINKQWWRIFYVYGPGQPESSLIPQLEAALKRGDEIFNMSGGQQERDYLPVEKLAGYMAELALKTSISGVFNICSGRPVKLETFIREYLHQHHPGRHIRLNLGYYEYNPLEPMAFWGDNRKLMKILNG